MVLANPLPARHAEGRPSDRRPASRPISVLIVDADPVQRRTLAGIISARSGGRFETTVCASAAEAEAAVAAGPGGIVIADLDTIGGATHLAEIGNGRATIAVSANPSLAAAVAAMKGGAADYLPKPIGAKALIEHLEAAVAGWQAALPSQPASMQQQPATQAGADFAGFVGRSAAMAALYDQIRRIGRSRAPVFITGESGTGKELTAEAIHARAVMGGDGRPFVAINCSAIPKDLMESEIFGHVRGAFTGASDSRTGAAELASGGTLFLDEITEMDVTLQAKLLRFVQTGSFRRVGGSELIHVDTRIVSATNRDPAAEIAAGRLRADLFYRLNVLPIHLAPLRQRRDDIPLLADSFLTRFAAEEERLFAAFDEAAMALLMSHPWPGNVRQLSSLVRRAVVLHDAPVMTAPMLSASTGEMDNAQSSPRLDSSPPSVASYHDQERAIIERALAAFAGNIPKAAAALDISPSTIYRKRQSWGDRPGL